MRFNKNNRGKKYLSRHSLIVKIMAAIFALIFAGSLMVQVVAYR